MTDHEPACNALDDSLMPTCAFSTRTILRIGTGATTKKKVSKVLWLVEQLSEDVFEVQKLNGKMVPADAKQAISTEEFYAAYHPEVELFNQKILPAMRTLAKHLARGDKHRRRGEPFSAEMEYKHALHIDERNVRGLFGLGLTYLFRGDTDKAHDVFTELVDIEGSFDKEHKHLFNEFGIEMRKNGMFDEAVEYYARGTRFDPNDEHIYFNLARAHFEQGDYERCAEQLLKSLNINSATEEAHEFGKFLVNRINTLVFNAKQEIPQKSDGILKAVDKLGKVIDVHRQKPKRNTKRARTQDKLFQYNSNSGEVDIIG